MKRREALGRLTGAAGSALLLAATGGCAATAREERGIPAIAAPIRETRTPAFKLPPGACDTHCHIFGPAARYPFSPQRSYTPPDSTLQDLRTLQETLGIDRAVIVNASLYGNDNRVILDAIAASGGRYRGIANVDDSIDDAALAALHKGGIRGCRFNFVRHLGGYPDMAVFDRTVARVARLGWHLDLHFDAVDLPRFFPLIERLPVPYIIDHMARVKAADGLDQKPFQTLLDLVRRDRKCYVKVTSPERISAAGAPFHDVGPFGRQVIEAAPDRVLWGTDWPHPNVKVMPNDADLVDVIPLYAPDPALRQQLLVDNPMRLYEFER